MIETVKALSNIPLYEPGRSSPPVIDVRERGMTAALRTRIHEKNG
jgi:hypothetical protein